jgi:hypothetical protein
MRRLAISQCVFTTATSVGLQKDPIDTNTQGTRPSQSLSSNGATHVPPSIAPRGAREWRIAVAGARPTEEQWRPLEEKNADLVNPHQPTEEMQTQGSRGLRKALPPQRERRGMSRG